MKEAVGRHDDVLRSAARGGAKTALAFVLAHHPEVKLGDVTKAIPRRYEDGTRMDSSKLLAAVSGYATRVAAMVNTSVYYKEHTISGTPTGETSHAEDDDSDYNGSDTDDVASVNERKGDGFHARDGNPSTLVEGSDKVCKP